jgi:hypothetical protein
MTCAFAPPAGLEPATRCLEGSRSIQLSYRGVSPDAGPSRGYAVSGTTAADIAEGSDDGKSV